MPVYWLDTNLIVRFLTGEPPDLAQEAKRVFQEAERGQYRLKVHPLVAVEAFYVLTSFYKLPAPEVAQKLLALLDREGVVVLEAEALYLALNNLGQAGLSLVDGLLLHSAQGAKEGLATQDKGLRREPVRSSHRTVAEAVFSPEPKEPDEGNLTSEETSRQAWEDLLRGEKSV